MFLCFRNGTAFTQSIDFGRAKSQLPENLIVVFSNLWGAFRGNFGDAMHFQRTADGVFQALARPFNRHDDLICQQLLIVHVFRRRMHNSIGDVSAVQHIAPVRQRLRAKDFIQNCRQLSRIGSLGRRIRD